MCEQFQPQHLAIQEFKLKLFTIEPRVVLVDNPMIIGADDNDVRGVVVLRTGEVFDVVSLHHTVAILASNALVYLVAIVVKLFGSSPNRVGFVMQSEQ